MKKPLRPRAPRAFRPATHSTRADGWTAARQIAFIEALAACACVEEACAAVGMSRQSAYRLRMKPEARGFRLAWDGAIDMGIRRLTDVCLSRAINGVAEPRFYKGEQIGEVRRYDHRLAMFLLRYRDPLRYAASLDQMVYTGHPENAVFGLLDGLDQLEAEALGCFDLPQEESPGAGTGTPYTRETIDVTLQRERERREIEDGGPVHGSFERRQRILALRAAHRRRLQAEADARAQTAARAAPAADALPRPDPVTAPFATPAMASPSSTSTDLARPAADGGGGAPRLRPL